LLNVQAKIQNPFGKTSSDSSGPNHCPSTLHQNINTIHHWTQQTMFDAECPSQNACVKPSTSTGPNHCLSTKTLLITWLMFVKSWTGFAECPSQKLFGKTSSGANHCPSTKTQNINIILHWTHNTQCLMDE
jgi:hypothetical protein